MEESEFCCENCWQFEEPEYSQRAGKCILHESFNPFKDSHICDDFENKND